MFVDGETDSGKTFLINRICAHRAKQGFKILAHNPNGGNIVAHWQTKCRETFLAACKASRKFVAVVHDAGGSIGRNDAEFDWLATEIRGNEGILIAATQEFTMCKPIFRTNAQRVIVFNLSPKRAKYWAELRGFPELEKIIPRLPRFHTVDIQKDRETGLWGYQVRKPIIP
ncbi:MAG: hypothetical protein ACKVPJ_07650 [Chitinophagales bacterium]